MLTSEALGSLFPSLYTYPSTVAALVEKVASVSVRAHPRHPAICNHCAQQDCLRGTARIPNRCPRDRRSKRVCDRDARSELLSLCIPLTSFGRIMLERHRPHTRDGSRPAAPDMASSVSRTPPSIDPRQRRFHRFLCGPIVCHRYLCLRRVLGIQETLSARNGSSPRCRAHRGSHVPAGQSLHTSNAAKIAMANLNGGSIHARPGQTEPLLGYAATSFAV